MLWSCSWLPVSWGFRGCFLGELLSKAELERLLRLQFLLTALVGDEVEAPTDTNARTLLHVAPLALTVSRERSASRLSRTHSNVLSTAVMR